MKIHLVSCVAFVGGLFGLLPLAHAGPGHCTRGVLNEIRIETISTQSTCQEFTVVAKAVDDCGDLLIDYDAPATWSDLSAALSPSKPAPFSGGVSITHSASVGSAFQGDVISITSGGVTGASDSFDVHACGCSSGATWSTVALFQNNAGQSAQARGIATTPDAVIAVGEATQSNGVAVWTVQRSIDRGTTWTTVDTFSLGAAQESRALSVAADKQGNVYVAGAANQSSGNLSAPHWVVRKSSDDGVHWSTVQDIVALGGASAVTVDSGGNVYVGGLVTGLVASEWLTEVSRDAGSTWTTVDTFSINQKPAFPLSIQVASTGQVIAVGQASDGTANHWIVRESDSGLFSTWKTVQDFQLAAGFEAIAHDVALDAHDKVVVVGAAKDAAGTLHWITRQAPISSTTWNWSTIQDLTISTELAVATGAIFTPQGQLYVSGETAHGAGQAGIFTTMVRQTPGSSFTVSDSLQGLDPIGGAHMAMDTQGDLFVAGVFSDSLHGTSWLVRRLSCD